MHAEENPPLGRSTISAPVLHGFVGADDGGRITVFNDAAELMLGFARDTVVGRSYVDVLVPARLRDPASLTRYAPGHPGAPPGQTVRVPVLTVTGEEIEVMLTSVEGGPEPTRFVGWFTPADPGAETFPAAMSGSALGNFSYDDATGLITMTESLWQVHGFESHDSISMEDYIQTRVHPDDRERMRTKLERRRGGVRTPDLLSWRIINPDGAVRTLLGDGRDVRAPDGTLLRVAGIARDVTDTEGTRLGLEAHRAVETALAAWESPTGGFPGVLRALVEAMDWRCGAMWMRSGETTLLACHAFWIRPAERPSPIERRVRGVEHRVGEGVPGRAWVSGHLETSSPGDRGDLSLAFPITDGDQTLAVLEFLATDAAFLPSELRQTLEDLGHHRLVDFCLRHQADLGLSPISERERQVLQLAADGGAIHAIAHTLGISASTVKTHFEHLYAKLSVSDRGGAVAEGFRRGLIR